VIDEISAKLILFSAIEAGNAFWVNEINTHGASNIYSKIVEGRKYLKQPNISKLRYQIKSRDLGQLQAEINQANAFFITGESIDWPASLNALATPPIGLVFLGNRESLATLEQSISIVGSRRPTNYGVTVAKKLSNEAALSGVCVVSGGAYGIDTAAHTGALAAAGVTISVLAGGVNLYPPENQGLFKQISVSGLLVSESMPSASTAPYKFLIRNRLIAALTKATVVVEAEFVSGSIRTARDAAEIFRPVFAIPGEITSPLSEGCHRLISERVADIATSLDEILDVITPLQLR
jgi:DNA processing protein